LRFSFVHCSYVILSGFLFVKFWYSSSLLREAKVFSLCFSQSSYLRNMLKKWAIASSWILLDIGNSFVI
jgi:hypothetical protein